MTAASVLLIALGGAIGALLRFGISRLAAGRRRPWLIVLINVLGSFAAGVIAAAVADETTRLALLTGFCGGFTTFSTASTDAAAALRGRERARAGALVAASVLVPLAGAGVGLLVGGALW